MGMVCDTCGKDAGHKCIMCEDCYEGLNTQIDDLTNQLEHAEEKYDALLEEYNNPLNKFSRGEFKDGTKPDTDT